MGGGGPRSRPGDDLPDSCKLYVGNLSPAVTDAVLKSLMEPFGNVLHAVVLLDMTTGDQLLASPVRLHCQVTLDGDSLQVPHRFKASALFC
jgi:RNA recognition motif-containing protein